MSALYKILSLMFSDIVAQSTLRNYTSEEISKDCLPQKWSLHLVPIAWSHITETGSSFFPIQNIYFIFWHLFTCSVSHTNEALWQKKRNKGEKMHTQDSNDRYAANFLCPVFWIATMNIQCIKYYNSPNNLFCNLVSLFIIFSP